MKQLIGAALVAVLVLGMGTRAGAQENKDAKTLLDKAIKALGGEDKLRPAATACSWKAKGKIDFGGGETDFTMQTTFQGLDRSRQEFEADFMGNAVKGVTVVNGNKGWRNFADNRQELEGSMLANQKRGIYLAMIPVTLIQLKDKDFKVELAGEQKVANKPALGLKVTPPDGKEFTLWLEKESSLPVRLNAKVAGPQGQEFDQETTFADYKELGGIKKATKIVSARDGNKFIDQQITEFKTLDKVDPKTFAEPQ